MKRLLCGPRCLALLLFALPIHASNAFNAATGGNVTGQFDNTFEIISDTTGENSTFPGPAYVISSLANWNTVIPGAGWIGPSVDQSGSRDGCCLNTGDTYQVTFSLTGYDLSVITMDVTLQADNYVDVLLNGNTVFTHTDTAMFMDDPAASFTIDSGFLQDTNTIDFVVTNVGGPTGLDALIEVSTPEPSSAVPLATSLLGALAVIALRKRNKSSLLKSRCADPIPGTRPKRRMTSDECQ